MPRGDGGLSSLLRQLRERKQGRWFLRPVDPALDGVPHYLSVIRSPMDFRTIGTKLERGEYASRREAFAEDVRLVFRNAIEFNTAPDDPVRRDARELSQWFESKWGGASEGGAKKKDGPRKKQQGSTRADEYRRVLRMLSDRPEAVHFAEPVDAVALGIPRYHEVVAEPMDLGTIRERLDRYRDDGEFERDVRLVFSNAMLFNGEGSPVYEDAARLSEAFEAAWGRPSGPFLVRERRRVLEATMAKDAYGVFKVPVDPVAMGIPDYLDVIKEPMDLGTMAAKEYATWTEFVRDGRLVFRNALEYNTKKGPVRLAAIEVSKLFESLVAPLSYVCDLEEVVEKAYALDESLFFRQPVDPVALGIPEYPTIIARPMSLDDMFRKIRDGEYAPPTHADLLKADADLVVTNAQTFNADPSHPIHRAAADFQAAFHRIWDAVFGHPPREEAPVVVVVEPPLEQPLRQRRQQQQQQQQQQHKPSEEVMRSLLGALKRKKDLCFYFLEPVDPVALRLPDYRDVIKRPMDLGTIESKLSSYETLDAFAADVRLVFTNAMTYNKSPKLAVHDAAKRLLHLFELRLAKAIKTTDLVVDVEDEPPPVEEEEEEEERPQKKRPGTKKRPHAPKATTTTEKEKPHLVVQKVSKLSAPGSKKKKEHPPLARSQTPQPVSPEPRLEVVDLSFIPTLIPVAPSAEDPPTRLDAWDLDALARDEETKRDEAPTALWETARAEAGRRREREDLEARRRTAHLAEARKLEKRRRQEQLAELERRRRRDEEEQRRLQEERDKEQRDADQKRQIEREQARRDREKLARTEDLDRKHTALASYIDNLEHFD